MENFADLEITSSNMGALAARDQLEMPCIEGYEVVELDVEEITLQ